MPKKYTDDVKKRAVELVLLAQSNPDTSYGAITRIAAQFDVKTDTLRTWIRRHESTACFVPGFLIENLNRFMT